MTAEVAIMNKSAIALAADSAVTIGRKIYNSVNKVFMLSKYQPVGIMIYGNASLMEVPWETVIKIFREIICNKKLNKLEDYVVEFINYFNKRNPLFPATQQKKYLVDILNNYISNMIKEVDEKVKTEIEKNNQIDDGTIIKFMNGIIDEHYMKWKSYKNLQNFDNAFDDLFFKKYMKDITKLYDSRFSKFNFSKRTRKKLEQLSLYLFKKDSFLKGSSGIVIAGFGEKEIFPSVITLQIEGIILNKLKYKVADNLSNKISYENSAAIIPFAQGDMVATFVEGVDPFYNKKVVGYLEQLFIEIYPKAILQNLKKIDESVKNETSRNLKEFNQKIFNDFITKMSAHRREFHIDPIINAVAVLPKDELASMAESLVNLTSLKRKISLDVAETVGGPIDVAVISKGDGFVWIKRKHYFKSELNQQFVANYFN